MSWNPPRHAIVWNDEDIESTIVLACGADIKATPSYLTTVDWGYVTCRECLSAREAEIVAAKVATAMTPGVVSGSTLGFSVDRAVAMGTVAARYPLEELRKLLQEAKEKGST